MRQFLVGTLEKEFKVNADRMIAEDNYIQFLKSRAMSEDETIAVFYDPEYAYELAGGKDVVIYGIMSIEDRYDGIMSIEDRYMKTGSDSTNLGEEN